MPDTQQQGGNSQSLVVDLAELEYEVTERAGGMATAIRFRLHNKLVRVGDVLVVLEAAEIRFHGMILNIEAEGWAVAVDRHGSTIPARVQ